jgi:hypothetical protein
MNYPMQSYGLGGLNTVQNMSDRNVAETLIANGGQRFAGGGISNIQRMAAGGIPRYTYDPITGKYTPVDAATAASSDVPKYTYDPVTQKYTLVTDNNPLNTAFAKDSGSLGGDATPTRSPFDDLTIDQRAAYYADNPREGKVASTLAGLFKDYTALGQIASRMDPIGFGERMASLRGVGLGPDGQMAQNNMVAEANSRLGIDIPDPGGLMGSLGDQPGDYDGQGGNTGGGQSISSDGQGGYGGTPGSNGPGDGSPSDYARGGLSALAQGGASNLGDYSDGGRLLRGPGDGVSDSIPATIANKRPARLADGEFVVPARIVSELGNGSTEAGARKLYQMLARVQNARKKSIGQGRVAVNSRAEKLLPA